MLILVFPGVIKHNVNGLGKNKQTAKKQGYNVNVHYVYKHGHYVLLYL